MNSFSYGDPVIWKPYTQYQRNLANRYSDWVMVCDTPYQMISGESVVHIAPRDYQHITLTLLVGFVRLVQKTEATEPEKISSGIVPACEPDAQAA